MAFVPHPTTVMAELLYTQDNQQMENTLYFDLGATPTALLMAALASRLADWWDVQIAAMVSNTVVLRAIKITSLESETAPAFELPVNNAGDSTGTAMPNNVTVVIKFLTAGRGRSARGRNYVVGLVDSQITGNIVDNATVSGYLAAYNLLRDDTEFPGSTFVVYSRIENGADRTVGLAQEVTGVAVTDNVVDSQRRRLPGRGN